MKKTQPTCRCTDGIVYTPWITVKGKRVYNKKGKMFSFPCTRCHKS